MESEQFSPARSRKTLEGFAVVDREGRITDANEAYCALTGYSKSELLGLCVNDIDVADDPVATAARIARIAEHGLEIFETLHRRKDGSTFDVEVTAMRLDLDGGRLVTFCRDITARKRAEEALEKRIIALTQPLGDTSDIAFEDLFNVEDIQRLQDEFCDATRVASLITRPDGTPITKPSNFTRFCKCIVRETEKGRANCMKSDAAIGRYHPEGPIVQLCLSAGLWNAGASIQVGGKHIANWLIGQVRDETQTEEHMRAYARAIEVDEDEFVEAFYEVPSMSRQQFAQVAKMLFTLAQQLSASAYQNVQQARFIADRKRVEDALRESEERLRLALAGADLGTWDWHVPSGVVTFNERWASMLGYSLDELEPNYRTWEGIVHPDDLPRTIEALAAHLEGKTESYESESRLRHKSGEWVWVLDRGGVIERDAQGKPLRVCGTHLDVTERKRAEAEKAALEMQLQQAHRIESVGRLAGGVAHDFNNMLGVILGHVEAALEQVDASQPLHAALEEIRRAAERSANLTRQLLAFARKQTIAPRMVNLNEVVAGMLAMLQRLVGENIRLAWQPEPELCSIKVDPSQIDQILANLCINARDAIADVGCITIRTENRSFDKAYCDEHADFSPGDYAMLAIDDDGCGMDKETLSHVFEPFFTTKSAGYGTGLGLATVYGIVKQNNGLINVYSEPGQGTSFKIFFPRYTGAVEQRREEGLAPLARQGRETILLVEDEPSLLKLTTAMLRRQGYTVLPASTPGEAIRLASEHLDEIQLLMTDVIMPEMNGQELARTLVSCCPNLRSLFMSGYTANVIAHHGVLEEGVHFIQKPFSNADLAAKLSEVLDKE